MLGDSLLYGTKNPGDSLRVPGALRVPYVCPTRALRVPGALRVPYVCLVPYACRKRKNPAHGGVFVGAAWRLRGGVRLHVLTQQRLAKVGRHIF